MDDGIVELMATTPSSPPAPLSLTTAVKETVLQISAGTVAGMSGIVAGQPFDTVKVRLQSGAFRSAVQCCVTTFRTEGLRGFFTGMSAPLLGNAPINAILFAVEHRASVALQEHASEWRSSTRHLVAGGISGLSQVIISCPSERVKILMQTTSATNASPWVYASKLLQSGGVQSLFRGWWMTIARDAPAFALYFWAYDQCKSWFHHRAVLRGEAPTSGAMMGPLPLMMSGGIAGLLSWALLHPVDVLKTMTQRVEPSAGRVSLRSLAKHAYEQEGLRFLTRGFLPTCLRAFPASAVTFLVYEWCVYLGVDNVL